MIQCCASPIRRSVLLVVILALLVTALPPALLHAKDRFTTEPPSPEFVAWQQARKAGKLKWKTDDGHPTGYIPPRFIPPALQHPGILNAPAAFPPVFDLRTLGRVTPVKDQGDCGSCWAFACLASLESCLLPGTTWDFSENNLKNTHGFDYPHYAGGSDELATAYLTRWSGPVLEMYDPYNPASGDSPLGLPPALHVQEILRIPERSGPLDNDPVKQAIMTYGGVTAGIWWRNFDYNPATFSFYPTVLDGSPHEICLVGWDDTFPASKFLTPPPGDGAFIAKNSWGNWWGEQGYFYISYYTFPLGMASVYCNAESIVNYRRCYQYDPLGNCGGFIGNYGGGVAWGANVFTALANEQLVAVSFSTSEANVPYEISIYTDPVTGPSEGTQAAVATGTYAWPGYHTLRLPTPVSLAANQRFSVVLKTQTVQLRQIPFEAPYDGYTSKATANPGESFLSNDGINWTDLTAIRPNANVSIKAFTTDDTPLYTLTASAGVHGAIAPAGTFTRFAGEDQRFTALPEAGYSVGTWSVDGVDVKTGGSTYTLSNIQANHTVAVTFRLQKYQPDLQIRLRNGDYIGDNMYDDDTAQTLYQLASPDVTAVYEVKLQNDGTEEAQFTLSGSADYNGWHIRYFDALSNGNDISTDIVAGKWNSPMIPLDGEIELRVEVTPDTSVKPHTVHVFGITAYSHGYPYVPDKVVGYTTCALPSSTRRMSVTITGAEGHGISAEPAISPDGRFVIFYSDAPDLIPNDINGSADIFLHDWGFEMTSLASVAEDESRANGGSYNPVISDQGRYAAFMSHASNLVPGDTNEMPDIFMRDLWYGHTERISMAYDGTQANGASAYPAARGSFDQIAFYSGASNLVPGDNNNYFDVFVRDLKSVPPKIVRVSVASDGTEGNSESGSPSISSSGRYVAFASGASNLVPGDVNGAMDVFIHDRDADGNGIFDEPGKIRTILVSTASDGTQGNAYSELPSISADGRFVSFDSLASNLVPGDTNGTYDVFVHDRDADGNGIFDEPGKARTFRVSVASDGTEGNNISQLPAISDDGRCVAFVSLASNLAPGDTNHDYDVFVHECDTGLTECVSVASDGTLAGNISWYRPAINGTGRYIAFASLAGNLVADDTNATYDIFLRDRGELSSGLYLSSAKASPDTPLTVPVMLAARGFEHSLAFSLAFNPAMLGSPEVTLGPGAGAATLVVDDSQAAQGRLGISLTLPEGQAFPAGLQGVLLVTFDVAPELVGNSTPLGFSNQPTPCRITDVHGNALPLVTESTEIPGNHAPTANAAGVTTDEDVPVTIHLTAADADGDSLTYRLLSVPAHGILSGAGANPVYTPNHNWSGADQFTFTASDGAAESSAVITITVNPVNDPPIAEHRFVTISQGETVRIALAAVDAEGDALSFRLVTGPAHGTLAGALPNPTYTPDPGWSGVDHFAYLANDGQADSNLANVAIVTYPANQPPEVGALQLPAAPVAVNTTVLGSASFTDDAGDTHTAVWDWGDGTTSAGEVNEIDHQVTGRHVYTAAGIYTVTLTITDASGGSASGSFQPLIVFNPAGSVTGGGWFISPPGALQAQPRWTGRVSFGFTAQYKKGAGTPMGQAEFNAALPGLNFHSTAYEWLVVTGAKAQLSGTGTLNGAGAYRVLLTATDGGRKPDCLRLQIWQTTTGELIYDTQAGAPDAANPAIAIQGGSIVIHK